jgi:hypothetical protein
MKCLCLLIGLAITTFTLTVGTVRAASALTAEWTVMVYMNAKNNLECDALDNFAQLATLGSNSAVHVVVEMGRPKMILDAGRPKSRYGCGDKDQWDGVLRFHVAKNQQPLPKTAVQVLGAADMGSADTLRDFVDWAQKHYGAKHYLLVIWNHGQGWRFQTARNQSVKVNFASGRAPAELSAELKRAVAEEGPQRPVGGFRSVSFDDDTGHFLYNRDIQDSLGDLLRGNKLDVLGFDACLMAMAETGYAFRSIAGVLVASEELEPGSGWDYGDVLQQIQDNAGTLDAKGMGKVLVGSYKQAYRDRLKTTMSAMDLAQMDQFADTVNTLATTLKDNLASERANIADARAACRNYGEDADMTNPVDIRQFANELLGRTKNADVSKVAKALVDSVDAHQLVYSNYASKRSTSGYGSFGVSIYFPATKTDFDSDPDKSGYVRSNSEHIVEFVQKREWSSFLNNYLQLSGRSGTSGT